jgi:TRAP-type C4-dicarboxylate transport system permease small subunit
MSELYVRAEDALSKFLLAAITLLVFFAAIMRTIGSPMIWSVDVAQLLFVWLCFLGANRAMRVKAHIGVDFFVRKMPHGQRWVLELALGLLTLVFLITLAIAGYRLTILNSQRIFGDSGISYAWVTSAVPVGCMLMTVTVLINLTKAIRDRKLVFYAEKSAEIDRSETQLG